MPLVRWPKLAAGVSGDYESIRRNLRAVLGYKVEALSPGAGQFGAPDEIRTPHYKQKARWSSRCM
eukprot:2778101-Amphidinium_carterae.1